MTEGVKIHQDAATTSVSRSRTSSLEAAETDLVSEEPDQEEEESSSAPEGQHPSTGGAEDSGGGPVAPDGGWGWVVVAATVLVLAMTLAFPSCIGIFYTDLQNDFQASNTETSWVPAIMIAVLHACGREGSLILLIHDALVHNAILTVLPHSPAPQGQIKYLKNTSLKLRYLNGCAILICFMTRGINTHIGQRMTVGVLAIVSEIFNRKECAFPLHREMYPVIALHPSDY